MCDVLQLHVYTQTKIVKDKSQNVFENFLVSFSSAIRGDVKANSKIDY